MRFLVIGLGSMGKRRIRNLKANGMTEIFGFDLREDRRIETEEKYKIKTYESFEKAVNENKFDAFVISVPPDKHMFYAHYAFDNNIHTFIEASVVEEGIPELLEKSKTKPKIVICPSCTLRHHPSIKLIKQLIDEGKLGKLSNFSYHSGQYLPDWHPWEDVKDFYVSNKETGGCREIVPFELTWLNFIFGDVKKIAGFRDKTIEFGADIDDVYTLNIRYMNGVIGTLIVDVVSRAAVRSLIINGDKGQVRWNWDNKRVEFYDADAKRWIIYNEPEGAAESGYNANIIEEMYISEIHNYIEAAKGNEKYINSLADDYEVLKCLYASEKSQDTDTIIKIKD